MEGEEPSDLSGEIADSFAVVTIISASPRNSMKRGLGSSSHDAEQKRARADAGLDGDAKLLRQLEYYFSDASFGFDEHLQSAPDASGEYEWAVVIGGNPTVAYADGCTT